MYNLTPLYNLLPWLIVPIIIVGLVQLITTLYREHRLRRSGIREIDLMGGHLFEERLKVLFKDMGYQVTHTGKYGGDYGADLLLNQNNVRTVVQAKRYRKKVGVKAIQEIVSAKGYYNAGHAMVVTNSYYTAPARRLATANNVILWDREQLINELIHLHARHS